MNIKEDCRKNKLTLIALYKIVTEYAASQGLDLDGPLSSVCERAVVNRTQVYERKAQLEAALEEMELAGPGRPENESNSDTAGYEWQGREVRENILRYRLIHPGAMVIHARRRTTYSDGFIRFVLDLLDEWNGSPEQFCKWTEIPLSTLRDWRQKDRMQPYIAGQNRPQPIVPATASETFRHIVDDYAAWEGGVRDFFKYETARLHLGPTPIRRVLVICGMLPVKSHKKPRYRGSTTRCQPGNVLVTDGKRVDVVFTSRGEIRFYNWQGIVDQATACHTAVVVTDTECADGVFEAFDASEEFLGQAPMALVHDNKPIHDEQRLREHIEKTTKMIPATPQRGENKAVIEGEFGKYAQAVGTIFLDDSSAESLGKSAAREVLRAYTAGADHAGRAEFDGKSRLEVLRKACPDPEKDREFIERLHANHTNSNRVDTLPTQLVSRALLNEGFGRFGIESLDPESKIRIWLAQRYTPEAIRQGLAIFETERYKGRLKNRTAHRYLVKLIQNCQEELDLRRQEELLREFAETERPIWLHELESEYEALIKEFDGSTSENDLVFRLSDNAVFGGLALQRSFWKNKLKRLLEKLRDKFDAVCRHIRRMFEATWENRFALISKIVNWEYQLYG